ncbi:imidazole glycerol phosphate synthase subunit HisH [Devosia sediminis]|uniref:Imidazole glycerol phosphate synthase subunit HisH n=1 Tax=Devosia sediminis TaxID=2798801 RepID=A0A934IQP5_9HYPH|nr:imidazole glycerol phosphate synthase subunit HisH [Devosia sediminis]MBJ3785063.1 imidazole glycerol phosphate synthase subunit HisH [Devosia sediminis]
MERIGILRMPLGNLQSVWNALYTSGFDPEFVDEHSNFDDFSHLIIPGVGHFKAVMDHLHDKDLPKRILDFAASGRPTLGICVGMQLLGLSSTEGDVETQGLGLVNGMVTRLPTEGQVLPHVGWSTVEFKRSHPVTEQLKQGRDYYFVHSYAMTAEIEDPVIGVSSYGRDFVSIVGQDNVVGFQFHPEKSQANGLQLLTNFAYWDGKC